METEIHRDVNKMATYMEVKSGSYFDIPLGATSVGECEKSVWGRENDLGG